MGSPVKLQETITEKNEDSESLQIYSSSDNNSDNSSAGSEEAESLEES